MATGWGPPCRQWDGQQHNDPSYAMDGGAAYWDGQQYQQTDASATDSHWPHSAGPDDQQQYWAQAQDDAGADPQQQQWQQTVDNPTFVETAAGTPMAVPSRGLEAGVGAQDGASGPGKQPVAGAGLGIALAPGDGTDLQEYSEWHQQLEQPPPPQSLEGEQPTDGSDPQAWQQQSNGWHTEEAACGEGGGQTEAGWQVQADQTLPQAFDQQGYSEGYSQAAVPQWGDPAARLQGDATQQNEYGQQQPEQQYPGYDAQAIEGQQAQWDPSPLHYGSDLANGDGQQAYSEHGWGDALAAGQQGFDGGDAQVRSCSSVLLLQVT